MALHHNSYATAAHSDLGAATHRSSAQYTLLGGLACAIAASYLLVTVSKASTVTHYVSATTSSAPSTAVQPAIHRPVTRPTAKISAGLSLPSTWKVLRRPANGHRLRALAASSHALPLQQGPIALLLVIGAAGAMGLARHVYARIVGPTECRTQLLKPLAINTHATLPLAMVSTSAVPPEGDKSAATVSLSPVEELLTGAFAGVLKICSGMPLLTWKIHVQAGDPLPTALPEWYRGVVVQAVAVMPIAALRFLIYGTLQKVLTGASPLSSSLKRQLTTVERLLAAFSAGICSAIIYTPVDMLTVNMQHLGLSLFDCARRILQDCGPLGFVRGVVAMAIREGIYTLGMFGLTPIFSEALVANVKRLRQKTVVANVLGALAAGIPAALLTQPLDTVKTRIQCDLMGTTYSNILRTVTLLVQGKGWGTLYVGCLPRTLLICLTFFIVQMLRRAYISIKVRRLGLT